MDLGSQDQMSNETYRKNGVDQDGMDSGKGVTKKDLDESFDSLGSLYSERSKKRRYKGKKDKKTGVTGRTWTKLEDPHAPRKPRSAYVHFLSSRRANYGTVKQGCDQKSINVALAAEWQALSSEEREKYIHLANQERTEYQHTMVAYQKTEHYAAFMEKKDLIMRQRKQCRKMGVESDSLIENLVLSLGEKEGRRGGKKKSIDMQFTVPTLFNTDIPIFSKEFLDYNKERESQLRLIRRAISVAEDEQLSMKRTIDRLHANCDALNAQIDEDNKLIKEADAVLKLWTEVASGALAKTNTAGEYPTSSPESSVDFLATLSSSADADVLQAVKEVLQNASFLFAKS